MQYLGLENERLRQICKGLASLQSECIEEGYLLGNLKLSFNKDAIMSI